MTVECKCEICGKIFLREKSQYRSTHTFCSRSCSRVWTSQRMSSYNKSENPMNKVGAAAYRKKPFEEFQQMRREKQLELSGGEYKRNTYMKDRGRHLHRKIAETIVGRPLTSDEVVHHINGDRRDNRPENLRVLTRAEHIREHLPEMIRLQRIKREERKGMMQDVH